MTLPTAGMTSRTAVLSLFYLPLADQFHILLPLKCQINNKKYVLYLEIQLEVLYVFICPWKLCLLVGVPPKEPGDRSGTLMVLLSLAWLCTLTCLLRHPVPPVTDHSHFRGQVLVSKCSWSPAFRFTRPRHTTSTISAMAAPLPPHR